MRGGKIIAAVALVSFAVSSLAFLHGERLGLEAVERLAYDWQLSSFTPKPETSPHVVVLAIDDLTFREVAANPDYAQTFGAWPYSRNFWAMAIEQLTREGAKAIVLDAVMDEPHPNEVFDLALADAVRAQKAPFTVGFSVHPSAPRLPRVVTMNRLPGFAPPKAEAVADETVPAKFDPSAFDAAPAPAAKATPEQAARALAFPVQLSPGLALETVPPPNVPIAPLLEVTPGFGMVYPEEDPDGKMRRTRFAYTDGENRYVTLAVAVAADVLGAEKLELAPGKLVLGPRTLRINPEGDAGIDYRGDFSERFATYSVVRVIDDWALHRDGKPTRLPKDLFRDKLVVIAGFAVGTSDMRATPFDSLTPGVSKHVAELESLLWGRFIVDAPRAVTYALIAVLALLSVALLTAFRQVALDLLWAPFAVLGLFALGGWLLTRHAIHLPLTPLAFATGLSTVGAIAFNRLFANQDRERIKEMFSRYLAKSVVDQLVDQDELPKLDGETREITAFFSDIRGFSTFSERFADDPKGLVKILNTYLTRVSQVLLDHGGCLDKYIGDAVVCIFGAPLRDPEHAVRACRASLAVKAEVDALRAEFKSKGLPDVYTRIGVNSAVMFVGNVGSEQLFDYTAIGDGMNLAARLEGANKNYDSTLMIGPHTYALAAHAIEVRELDCVRVAGKTEAVAVYELLALKGQLPEGKRAVCDHYAKALAHFRAARFTEARDALDAALTLDPEDGPSKKLRVRCERYLQTPPPMPFDPVAQLEK